MEALLAQFSRCRDAGVPLIAVRTADPYAALKALAGHVTEPAVFWDVARGMSIANEAGQQTGLVGANDDTIAAPMMFLRKLLNGLKPEQLAFALGLERFWQDPLTLQALWNLRDAFKSDGRALVAICRTLRLPPDLVGEVYVLDDALPSREEIGTITDRLMEDVGGRWRNGERNQSLDALAGLSRFASEQSFAVSLSAAGIEHDSLWRQKREAIEQIGALRFERGTDTFESIGGLETIKQFGKRLMEGRQPPAVVCRIEEIEKCVAGAQGDLSGVSQDAMQVVLNAFEDFGWSGILAMGPPGAGKSQYAKCLGNTYKRPTLVLDIAGAKGSLVGESEQKIREAIAAIKAMGEDRVFFVATANKLDTVPAELRRRFRYGTYFFDLPDAIERDVIWKIHKQRYGVTGGGPKYCGPDHPVDEGWTGADIRNCCELASRLSIDLADAAAYIVPTSQYAAEAIEASRAMADGRFLSASSPGVYRRNQSRLDGKPNRRVRA